jgi:hypothetical protein
MKQQLCMIIKMRSLQFLPHDPVGLEPAPTDYKSLITRGFRFCFAPIDGLESLAQLLGQVVHVEEMLGESCKY